MSKKAPLPMAEEIRRIRYLEDGGWNLAKMKARFKVVRSKLHCIPEFEDLILNFDSNIEAVEGCFAQLQSDYESSWKYALEIRQAFETVYSELKLRMQAQPQGSEFEELVKRLSKLEEKLEFLENHFLTITDRA